ncbi:hypothetical protein A7M48_19780 [Acinetobacter baumannii]|nr:hypothetical protein A7M48_19780 [Acinetobacter baumannii]
MNVVEDAKALIRSNAVNATKEEKVALRVAVAMKTILTTIMISSKTSRGGENFTFRPSRLTMKQRSSAVGSLPALISLNMTS